MAKTANPPPVISVETAKGEDGGAQTEGEKHFGQARTPKHANKTHPGEATPGDQPKITPDRSEKPDESRAPYSGSNPGYSGGFAPPRPYEGRPLGGGGAFQPHEPRRQPPPPGPHGDYYGRSQPMHNVSPRAGHARYYSGPSRPPASRLEGAYPPHHSYYEQRGYSEYGPARQGYEGHPPPPAYRGSYHPGAPPPTTQTYPSQSYGGYPSEGRGYPPHQTTPPGAYHGAQSYPPTSVPPEHYARGDGRYPVDHIAGTSGTFTRAVSSSFDRSIKSRPEDKSMAAPIPGKPQKPPMSPGGHRADASMASDDSSWKQLKQVHSVDDSAIRERLKKDNDEEDKHIQVEKQPASTSSSLTNSPTEGPERLHAVKEAQRLVAAAAAAVEPKPASSLDSLSSVASAQRPMETSVKKPAKATKDPPPPSPGADSASLDLMKCHSGSSGLLHLPAQHRNMDDLLYEGKRSRDEERGDVNTDGGAVATYDEIRRAPSEYDDPTKKSADAQPPSKKTRIDEKIDAEKTGDSKAKASPLSITCSPSAEKAKESAGRLKSALKSDYTSPQPMENSFYDKPPTYSYSIDSAPSLPREGSGIRKQPSYPSLPPRPGSSSSSTITPGAMHVDDARVPSVPSWEIHAQDSFGNGSIGGGQGLTSSFSFQDYPMLPATETSDSGSNPASAPAPPPHHGHPPSHHPVSSQPPLESRNQSFEGGHYHGSASFHRSESMDVSYGGRPAYSGHQGQFPPHAPSWGTAGSSSSHPSAYQPPGHYQSYGGSRMPHDYTVMRNYSHDSAHRTSPPVGPGMHPRRGGPPAGFQPPSEFAAPHNPHLMRRPPPAVYIMPTSQAASQKRGNGVFSWTKDDDSRLSDIMKKFKNPRDWEPIAKEHGRGKTAKECHERWIRYLKPGVRKGQWTDQEDAIVIEAVTTSTEQPFTRWSDLAQQLPGRVGKQIRDRWVNHLNPNINHLPFSREDDMNLWNGHQKLGKRWVEISTKFFNSSRSENHIKNRWYSASFKKFISNEFGPEAYSGTSGSGKKRGDKKKRSAIDEDDEEAEMEAI